MLEFLCGTLVAAASERLTSRGWRAAGPMLGAALLWLVAAYSGPLGGAHFVMCGPPAVLTVAGLLALERTLKTQPWSLGLLIGDASYSLYLCHPFAERVTYLVLPTAAAVANPVIGLLFIAVASLAAILCAVAIYRYFEQPTLAALRRGTRRSRVASFVSEVA